MIDRVGQAKAVIHEQIGKLRAVVKMLRRERERHVGFKAIRIPLLSIYVMLMGLQGLLMTTWPIVGEWPWALINVVVVGGLMQVLWMLLEKGSKKMRDEYDKLIRDYEEPLAEYMGLLVEADLRE